MKKLMSVALILLFVFFCRNIFAEGDIITSNFKKAQTEALKNECIANMKVIEGAVVVWQADTNAPDGARPTKNDLVPNYIKSWEAFTCEGKEYAIPAAGEKPRCPNNIEGHVLYEK